MGRGRTTREEQLKALRTRDGDPVEEISLEEARRVAAEHGLPLPEGK